MTTEENRPHTVAIVTASATHPMQFRNRAKAVKAFEEVRKLQEEYLAAPLGTRATTTICDDFDGAVFFDRSDFRSVRLVDVAAEHEAANALRLIAGRAERDLEIAARSIAAAPPAQKFQL